MTKPILPPPIHNLPPQGASNNSKRMNKVVLMALLIIVLCLGIMFSWAVDSTEVVVFNEQPIPIRTIREHPTEGGVVFLDVDTCKTRNIDGKLRISYVSASREMFLPEGLDTSPKGCVKGELPIPIPANIPADTYRVKIRLTYDVNPLKRSVIQDFYSSPVIIDPPTVGNPNPEQPETLNGLTPTKSI